MDKEDESVEHKRGYIPLKHAKKENHEKTISELHRRNAHLHAKPDKVKNGKKDSSVEE